MTAQPKLFRSDPIRCQSCFSSRISADLTAAAFGLMMLSCFMRWLLLSNGSRQDRLAWRAIRSLLGYRGWRALSDSPPQRVLAEAVDLARREPQLAFAVWQSFHVREPLFDQVGDAPQRIRLSANFLLFPRDGWNLAAFRVACRDSSSASHIWTCFQLAARRRPFDFTKTQSFRRTLRFLPSNSARTATHRILAGSRIGR